MSLAYIRACQRGCTYCKKQGHLKPNCPVAFQKCEEIKNAIDLIVNSGRREEERLSTLFNSENLTDLCFLMNERNFKQFIKKLVENGSITEEESKMRLKRQRVKVLMLRYWYCTIKYTELQARVARTIIVKTPENVTNLSEFECPICVSDLPAKEKVETSCKHCVCKDCFVKCLEHKIYNMDFSIPKCSMCRTDISQIIIYNTDYVDEVTELTNVM
jgi:hypothetical protein